MSVYGELTRLHYRRTRIVATVGPASDSEAMLERLLAAGVDVVRMNFSHGDHAGHAAVHRRVRRVAAAAGREVGILADLCGPKIRVGTFPDGGIDLVDGELVTVTTRPTDGRPGLIPSQYAGLAGDVAPGQRLLLADGLMTLLVRDIEGPDVRCEVVHGGRLTDRKGINLPDTQVSAPCLTAKDLADLTFAAELGVDFVALSFVRRADDILELRQRLDALACPAQIVAKIERPEAVTGIDTILQATDVIMVARGDLGVELPPEQVPVAQQHLIDRARRSHVPVIVATQMLESMIDNARPTRAEVTDIAHSVNLGVDAVMLSAESAAGRYPELAVATMDRIAREAEAYLWSNSQFGTLSRSASASGPSDFGTAIGRAIANLSRDLMVRAVFVVSRGGLTARELAGERPAAPLVMLSASEAVRRQGKLLWGVLPASCSEAELDDPVSRIRALSSELALADSGQVVLVVRGFDRDPERNRPSITLLTI